MRIFQCLSLFSSLVLGQVQQPMAAPPKLSKADTGNKPNILFILTDDQDLHMNSLDYLPYTKKHLIEQGTLFKKHYCTIALCCPSRVSLWTGKAAHNTVWTTPLSCDETWVEMLMLCAECDGCQSTLWWLSEVCPARFQ